MWGQPPCTGSISVAGSPATTRETAPAQTHALEVTGVGGSSPLVVTFEADGLDVGRLELRRPAPPRIIEATLEGIRRFDYRGVRKEMKREWLGLPEDAAARRSFGLRWRARLAGVRETFRFDRRTERFRRLMDASGAESPLSPDQHSKLVEDLGELLDLEALILAETGVALDLGLEPLVGGGLRVEERVGPGARTALEITFDPARPMALPPAPGGSSRLAVPAPHLFMREINAAFAGLWKDGRPNRSEFRFEVPETLRTIEAPAWLAFRIRDGSPLETLRVSCQAGGRDTRELARIRTPGKGRVREGYVPLDPRPLRRARATLRIHHYQTSFTSLKTVGFTVEALAFVVGGR